MNNKLIVALSCATVLAQADLPAQRQATCDTWPSAEFFCAATVADVLACLDAGADPLEFSSGEPPLVVAVKTHAEPAVVRALLAAGADVDARGLRDTPLGEAVRSRSMDSVEILLAAGGDIYKIARVTSPYGAPVVEAFRGASALRHYAAGGYPATVELLLKAGVAVNARDRDGLTALHDVGGRHVATIDLLLRAGADVNARSSRNHTPLHMLYRPDPKAVAVLLGAGADVNARSDSGQTPLHTVAGGHGRDDGFALEDLYGGSGPSGERKVIGLLLEAGAEVNARTDGGATPLHYAATNKRDPDVVLQLIAAGAEVDAKDASGRTPLSWAVFGPSSSGPVTHSSAGNFPAMERLLAAGADEAVRDAGVTALHAATTAADSAPIELLLEAGVPVDARDARGRTPLHWAAEWSGYPQWVPQWGPTYGETHAVETLLAAGASVEARTNSGRTPLHLAVARNWNPLVVELLLAAGADVEARDEHGLTPLDLVSDSPIASQVPLQARLVAARQGPIADEGAFRLTAEGPSAVEAALGLDWRTRRLIIAGLRNEGFEAGWGAEFLHPVRRAIRVWQDYRGEATTGYLDATQAAVLEVAGRRRRRCQA